MTKDDIGSKLTLIFVEAGDTDGEPIDTLALGTVKAVDISENIYWVEKEV